MYCLVLKYVGCSSYVRSQYINCGCQIKRENWSIHWEHSSLFIKFLYLFSNSNYNNLSCRYKGEGIVNGSPQKVWECLKPEPNGLRLKWDNNVKKFELLEQVSVVGFVPAVDFTLMNSHV